MLHRRPISLSSRYCHVQAPRPGGKPKGGTARLFLPMLLVASVIFLIVPGCGGPGAGPALDSPGVEVRKDGVLQAGEFARPRSVVFSDDGKSIAFVTGEPYSTELWVMGWNPSSLKRLLSLEDSKKAGQAEGHCEITLLGWAPRSHKIRFIASGAQAVGPHRGESGFWVGEVDARSAKIRDVAFIPGDPSLWPRDLGVTQDRTHAFFRMYMDIWRVNLESGEKAQVASEVPNWDGLLRLRYSPSGWATAYMTYDIPTRQPVLIIHDLQKGEKLQVSVSPRRVDEPEQSGRELVDLGLYAGFFQGWAPGELAAVALAMPDEVNRGEGPDLPAGAVALRFYDTSGKLKYEVEAPDIRSGKRIGKWAWSPDGTMLAVIAGPLVSCGEDPLTANEVRDVAAAEVWLGRIGEWGLKKLSEIQPPSPVQSSSSHDGGAVTAERISWMPDGSAIEIWFNIPNDQSVTDQSGVRVSRDGTVTPISRPIEFRYLDRDYSVGEIGDRTCFVRTSRKSNFLFHRIFLRDARGKETVIVEGEIEFKEARVEKDVLLILTGKHVYMVRR